MGIRETAARIFGREKKPEKKQREEWLPGVKGSKTPELEIPKTQEGQEVLAAAKGIHPYAENTELENIESDEEEPGEDVDVSDLK